MLKGEWWIDSQGNVTFADDDIGDYNHVTVALEAALNIDLNDVSTIPLEPFKPFDNRTIKWLREHGSDEEAINFLKDGSDPREYALSKLNWIRVANNNFQVMDFTESALNNICNFLDEILEDDKMLEDDNITIEEISSGDMFDVPIKMIMNKATVPGIKRYCLGYGKEIDPKGGLSGSLCNQPSSCREELDPIYIADIITEDIRDNNGLARQQLILPYSKMNK